MSKRTKPISFGKCMGIREYSLTKKYILRITERHGSDSWQILRTDGKRKKTPCVDLSMYGQQIVVKRGLGWFALRHESGEKEITHNKSLFDGAVKILLLYFHEKGHQAIWKKSVAKKLSVHKDEELAWIFAISVVRDISRRLGTRLINKKNRKQIFKWIRDYLEAFKK